MSKSRLADRRHDARRLDKQSMKAKLFRLEHPNYDYDRRKKERGPTGHHLEPCLENLLKIVNPIRIKSSSILVAPDWHIPFHSADLVKKLLDVRDEYGIRELAVPGDFWDCDNYKRFLNLPYGETFRDEIEYVKMQLQILVDEFDGGVYFCRGNHEKRWTDTNLGMMGMKELFAVTGITSGYDVTEDPSIMVDTAMGPWCLSHPRQYRQTKLSLADVLAEKYHCNMFVSHGHFFSSGWSRSGCYQIVDGGGIFDAACLMYLRDITTFPWTLNGFWWLRDGYAVPFEGDRRGK